MDVFAHNQLKLVVSNSFPSEFYSLKKIQNKKANFTTKTALNLVCSVFSWILHVSGSFRLNAPQEYSLLEPTSFFGQHFF